MCFMTGDDNKNGKSFWLSTNYVDPVVEYEEPFIRNGKFEP